MDTLKVMGQRLKELRNEKRRYQRELGELLDISTRHYQKIERGEVNISVLALCSLADYFEVSVDYLLGRTDER